MADDLPEKTIAEYLESEREDTVEGFREYPLKPDNIAQIHSLALVNTNNQTVKAISFGQPAYARIC